MAEKRTCVIVGAGAGGLACGAILAKNGLKTIIFEKERVIGGCAKTLYFNGYWLEEGIHYMFDIPGTTPHRDKVGQLAGIKTDVARMKGPTTTLLLTPQGELIPITKVFPLSADYDRATLKRVYKYLTDADAEEVESFAKWMMEDLSKVLSSIKLETFDDVIRSLPYIPIKEWVLEKTKNEKVLLWILDLAGATILIPPESVATCSTYIVLTLFMALMGKMISYVYPVHEKYGGGAAILEPYADMIRANGGEVYTDTPVKKIVVKEGKAKGVIIERRGEEEFIAADVVVCNVAPQLAYRAGILDVKSFPSAYKEEFLQKAKKIEEGARRYEGQTVNVHIALKKPLTDNDSFTVLLDDEGRARGGLQIYSNFNPTSVPMGKQLLYQCVLLYKAARDFKVAERYATDVVLPPMRKWLKDFDENVEWCMISFSTVPYAELNQQMFSNSETFDLKTAVKNLYFVGMFTGYIGHEGSMLTGAKGAEQILGRKLL